MRENRKILLVAFVLAVVCGSVLSISNSLLKKRIEQNRREELCRRILSAISVESDNGEQDFLEKFSKLLIFENGSTKTVPASMLLNPQFSAIRFVVLSKVGAKPVVHLVGKGLWGEMRGFAALEEDFTTLRGVSFYQSSETPGLGAQFSDPEVLKRFQGKVVNDSFKVVNKSASTDQFSVDGISGATITGKSVEKILKEQIKFYRKQLSEWGNF